MNQDHHQFAAYHNALQTALLIATPKDLLKVDYVQLYMDQKCVAVFRNKAIVSMKQWKIIKDAFQLSVWLFYEEILNEKVEIVLFIIKYQHPIPIAAN